MLISCVIPSYNQGDYLAEAIESALRQTRSCEIIVVDDGSTDGSAAIAAGYPVKLVRQVNKGLPSARNTGIMNATQAYVLPLDADDMLLETCVERMEAAIARTGADVVAPSFRRFGTVSGDAVMSGFTTLAELKVANRLPYFSAIKRDVLLEVGGYNPKMRDGYEDYDLWFDIFKRSHSLTVLSEILVLYRTKETSMITEAKKHHDALMAQIRANHPEVWG